MNGSINSLWERSRLVSLAEFHSVFVTLETRNNTIKNEWKQCDHRHKTLKFRSGAQGLSERRSELHMFLSILEPYSQPPERSPLFPLIPSRVGFPAPAFTVSERSVPLGQKQRLLSFCFEHQNKVQNLSVPFLPPSCSVWLCRTPQAEQSLYLLKSATETYPIEVLNLAFCIHIEFAKSLGWGGGCRTVTLLHTNQHWLYPGGLAGWRVVRSVCAEVSLCWGQSVLRSVLAEVSPCWGQSVLRSIHKQTLWLHIQGRPLLLVHISNRWTDR